MTFDHLQKVCVILGAGASWDVHDIGSRILDDRLKPPLADELFLISSRPEFSPTLNRYPGAYTLGQTLATLTSTKQQGLEDSLRHYAYHKDERAKQLFKHIPPYLRDLMYKVSTQYTEMPSTYIQLALELLIENPHHILFLVLNYDNLLETALKYVQPSMIFPTISHYISPKHQAKVVKLHGSIDWLRLLGKAQDSWDHHVEETDIFEKVPEHEILIESGVNFLRDFQAPGGQWCYPILTAPLAGKGPTDTVCPESHIKVAQEFLSSCRKFLIIGSSGLDEDLLSLLDSSISHENAHIVDTVNIDEGARNSFSNFQRGVGAFRQDATYQQTRLFEDGFRTYVRSSELRLFAQISP